MPTRLAMLFRMLRQRGSVRKLAGQWLRPAIHGGVTFLASLIVWKFLLGVARALDWLGFEPGLRTQYLVPLAIGAAALAYRLYRDLGPGSKNSA